MTQIRNWLAAALTGVLVASMGLVFATPAGGVSYGLAGEAKYTAVHLTWTSQGTDKTYQVQYGTSSTFKSATTLSNIATNSTYINRLSGNKTYYFRVRTTGTSSWSPKVTKKTSFPKTYNGTAVEKATKISTDNVSGSAIDLTWTTPSGQYACFRVQVSPAPTTGQPAIQCTTAFTLTGLKKSTKYGIKLYTVAPASGGWPAIDITSATSTLNRTTSDYPLAGPDDLALVTPQRTNQATLTWTAPTNPSPGSNDAYRVLLAANSGMTKSLTWYTPKCAAGTTPCPNGTTTATKLTLTGLSSNKVYYARVVVVDATTLKQRSDRSGYLLVKTLISHGTLTGSVSTSASTDDVVAVAYNSEGEIADQSSIASDGTYKLSVRPYSSGSTQDTYKVRITYIGHDNYYSSWVSTTASPAVNSSQASSYKVGNEASTSLPTTKIAAGNTVSGTVIDAKTGKAVAGAMVSIRNTDGSTELLGSVASSSTGAYSFTGIPGGTYIVRASYVGSSTYKNLSSPKIQINGNLTYQLKLPRK
jgi:hypothetical protein